MHVYIIIFNEESFVTYDVIFTKGNFSYGKFDLTQLITDATRVRETTRTLVDVIFVNNDHRIADSGVVSVSLSDHYLIYCNKILYSSINMVIDRLVHACWNRLFMA